MSRTDHRPGEPSARSIERLETARLIYERQRPEHAEELFVLLRDPRVARTLTPTGHPPTEADVIDGLRAKIDHWDRHGFGLWLLRDRATGAMGGRGGRQHTWGGGAGASRGGRAGGPQRRR